MRDGMVVLLYGFERALFLKEDVCRRVFEKMPKD